LAKTRDELRQQAQLAKTETRSELHRLETLWQRMQDDVRRIGSHDSVNELSGAAVVLLDELKHGYERVRRDLLDDKLPKAIAVAEHAAVLPFARTIESLASQIGAHADARALFGTPVTHGNITIVPVARVVAGFGAGARQGGEETAAGSDIGGGGGYAAVPLGFIEISEDGARFQRLEGSIESWTGMAELTLRLARRALNLLAAKKK
ncbi:MAG TPA: spore germination protein GerW family protein, partial [Polyangiales bacterium]